MLKKYIMKKLIFIIILLIIQFLFPQRVNAIEKESESTASLVIYVKAQDIRTDIIRQYLFQYNSPLSQEAEHIIYEADRFGLDWKLIPAIAGVESTFGKRIPYSSYNAWGWGIPTGARSGIQFSSWKEGITVVSYGLKTKYIDRGAVAIEQIGAIYAASPRWPQNVRFFMSQIDTFAENYYKENSLNI